MAEQMEVEVETNMEVLMENIEIDNLKFIGFKRRDIFLTIKNNRNNKEISFEFYGLLNCEINLTRIKIKFNFKKI